MNDSEVKKDVSTVFFSGFLSYSAPYKTFILKCQQKNQDFNWMFKGAGLTSAKLWCQRSTVME